MMRCPKCGNIKAIQLLVSWQCPNPDCNNYDSQLYKELLEESIDKFKQKFKQTGTVIGRFSANANNLSNLPKSQIIFSSQAGVMAMACSKMRDAGFSVEQIAKNLGITRTTVYFHLYMGGTPNG